MAKRISDVERIANYFELADEGAANVMLQVIRATLTRRFPPVKKTVKRRGPNKPKLTLTEAAAAGGTGPGNAVERAS